MRKIIKRIFIIMIAILLLTTVNCFATDDEELNIENFITINAICHTVEGKLR